MAQNKYTLKARFEIGTAKSFTNATDVDIATDNIRILNHGFKTGQNVGISVTSGTITTGLTATTAYYVIQVDSSTIALATSRANAFAGTKVDLTAIPTGVIALHAFGNGVGLSGVIIPANHYVVDSHYLVHTTGVATVNTGTLAIMVEGANDVVSAAAISTSVWDDTGAMVEGIVDLATEASYLLTTADREVTFTTGTSPWTAGKLDVFLEIQPALA